MTRLYEARPMARALCVFGGDGMGVGAAVQELWGRVTGVEAAAGERKTAIVPLGGAPFLAPCVGPGGVRMSVVPKPTAVNLRRFAEMPVARRAINVIKDRVACMDWRIELRPDAVMSEDASARARV